MKEERKTKTELLEELVRLRKRVARLEKEKTGRKVQKGLARKDDPSVRPFYENLALGYQSLDEKGCFLDVNQTWLDMLGYSREEVIGRWFGDFITPGYRSQFEEIFKFFKAAGEIKDIEFEMVRKDGTRLVVAYDGRIQCDGQRNFKQTHCLMKDITKRKKLEVALRESEVGYKELADSITDVFFAMDKDLKYTYWNKASENLTGISEKDAIGRSLYDIFPEIKGTRTEDLYLEVLRTQQPQSFVSDFKLGDKDYFFEINAYPSKKGLSVFVKDITKHKRMEEKLRETGVLLEGVFEGTTNPVFLKDRAGRYILANSACVKIFNRPRAEIIGKDDTELFSPEIGRQLKETDNRIMDSGKTEMVEEAVNVGQEIYAFASAKSPYRDVNGKIVGLIGIAHNITERKRAEEALQESEKRYRTVVQDQTEIICRFDPDGRYVFVNDVYCRFFGKSKDELVGHKWFPDAYPEDLEMIQEKLKTMSPDNPVILIENRVYSGGNALHWMQFINRGFYDQQGTLLEIQSVGRDITERKRAEEEIGRSREQLRTLSSHLQSLREEERALMAREIHDELGQALTILKMDSFWLAQRFPENQKDLIEKTQSMSKLIDSTIQTVRRISTELRPGILDDLGLIAAIEWQTQDFQDRTGIKCEFHSSLEEVELDRNHSTAVFRIFQETLTNVARHANATQVNINVREEEKNLLVEIEDNGRGITESEISDPKSLGLLGMRERAHIFGGEVMVKGEPGKGTKVIVKIPLDK